MSSSQAVECWSGGHADLPAPPTRRGGNSRLKALRLIEQMSPTHNEAEIITWLAGRATVPAEELALHLGAAVNTVYQLYQRYGVPRRVTRRPKRAATNYICAGCDDDWQRSSEGRANRQACEAHNRATPYSPLRCELDLDLD